MKKIKYVPLLITATLILYSLGFNVVDSFLDWTNVTIQQIQFKAQDSLLFGKDKSDLLGDSVQLVCRVVASPRVSPATNDYRTLLRGTSSWTCYAQDTANGLWGGIVIRQGSRGPATGLDLIDTGSIIRVRGIVQEFPETGFTNSLTQIGLDTAVGYTIDILQPTGQRPVPKLLNITEFATGDPTAGGTINYMTGEKYEGMYVEFRNVTVAPGVSNRHPWTIVDDNGNKMFFRDFSNFFSTQPSGDTLRPWSHPATGTLVNYVRGVIISANNTDGIFGNNLPYSIVPIYPSDLSLGNAPPAISNVIKSPGVPTPTDNVTITCTIIDPALKSMSITDAKVIWKAGTGSYNQVQMNNVGSVYTGQIPAQPLNTLVQYFIRAQDSLGAVKLYPSDTAKSKMFYVVKASDSLSIQEVQYCPNNGGHSGYEGGFVRGIEGICTADTSDIRNFSFVGWGGTQTSPPRVIIQNGTGPFSAIWIYSSPANIVQRGDKVRVRGNVEYTNGMIRINVATPSDVQIISTGNPLPDVQIMTTQQLANSYSMGDTAIKKWESVFVRINTPVTVSCVNAGQYAACLTQQPMPDTAFRRNYGEVLVRDLTGVDGRIELQDGNHNVSNGWDTSHHPPQKTILTRYDTITYVQGILYYSYGNYKIVPRRQTDFGNIIPVSVSYNPVIIGNYSLSQNYPNPFNPVTKINFSLPVNAKVTLKIYDILGREMNVLFNQYTSAGAYIVEFNAVNYSSGVYFYRLEAEGNDGSRYLDVKRMILIK